jgi:hypothetical protein
MSDSRAWPPLDPHIDVRVASTVNNLANNSEQLFSKPNGLVEIEVAEIGSQGKALDVIAHWKSQLTDC